MQLTQFLHFDENVLPTVLQLLKYLIALPVTTEYGERSFSTLKHLKTYLRNTTSEKRLNGLALLNIQQEINVTPDIVLNLLLFNARKLNLRIDQLISFCAYDNKYIVIYLISTLVLSNGWYVYSCLYIMNIYVL